MTNASAVFRAARTLAFVGFLHKRKELECQSEPNLERSKEPAYNRQQSISSPVEKATLLLPVSQDIASLKKLPHAVQIISSSEQNTLSLNQSALDSILTRPDVVDKPVVVISVAGAVRTGKSFFLNFMLRYLKAYTTTSAALDDKGFWLKDDSEALSGFESRASADSVTSGIWIWSEPFFRTLPDGQDVVVLLMDTQGMFDTKTTTLHNNCAIFALSTLISSVQIFNVHRNIQEDHMNSLEVFTGYGMKGLAFGQAPVHKPFQKLWFLVRDWPNPPPWHGYGAKAGKILLDDRFQSPEEQPEELRKVRQNLFGIFESIEGFLLPHPGLEIVKKRDFAGRLKEIDPEFIDSLRELMPLILVSENLLPKTVNGQQIKAGELVEFIKAYFDVFQHGDFPKVDTLFQASIKADNHVAMKRAKHFYIEEMKKICGAENAYFTDEILAEKHKEILSQSLKHFQTAPKMGGNHNTSSFLISELEDEIQLQLPYYQERNRRIRLEQQEVQRKNDNLIGFVTAEAASTALAAALKVIPLVPDPSGSTLFIAMALLAGAWGMGICDPVTTPLGTTVRYQFNRGRDYVYSFFYKRKN